MAVYKATLCYPFLNAIDIRTAQYKDYSAQPIQLLTCKIDSSNTNITGYKIRILSSDNLQIFPVDTTTEGKISPISELMLSSLGYDPDKLTINSGLNGTTLKIPFFQNNYDVLLTSHNAVYYTSRYLVDHIIGSTVETGLNTPMDNINNWTYNNGELTYNWAYNSEGNTPTQEEIQENNIILDGQSILIGENVLVLNASNLSEVGIYEVTGVVDEQNSTITTVLVKRSLITLNNQTITILKGNTLHNYAYTVDSTGTIYTKNSFGGEWVDRNGNTVALDSYNSNYKWEITLYQGNYVENSDNSITYEDVDSEWLDITLSNGKIMGSTPNRIQIASDDDDNNGENKIYLPEGIDGSPVVLQGKYIELNSSAIKPTSILSGGTRTYVKTYDAVYGHAYPREDVLSTANINNAHYCQFFKYSSNPEEILNTDIVSFCFDEHVLLNGWTLVSTDTSSDEQKTLTQEWQSWTIDPGDKTVNITNRYIAIANINNYPGIIDDVTPSNGLVKDGDLILLANQNERYQNGVYQINRIVDSHTISKWCLKRVNGYNQWANYLGKIIYCQNGTSGMRSINMQSLASAGGTLWDINSNNSGTSYLDFDRERPLLLFPQKIIKTFNLYDAYSYSTSTVHNGTTVDFRTVCVGDVILYRDNKYATVTEVGNDNYTTTEPIVFTADQYGYYYISDGRMYKEKVVYVDLLNITENWDLHTATILHNSVNKTFISPWKNLQPNMKLALLNNKKIKMTLPIKVGQSLVSGQTQFYINTDNPTSKINEWLESLPYDTTFSGIPVQPLVLESGALFPTSSMAILAAKLTINTDIIYAILTTTTLADGVLKVIYATESGTATIGGITFTWNEGFNNLESGDKVTYINTQGDYDIFVTNVASGWWNGGLISMYEDTDANARWIKVLSCNDTIYYIKHNTLFDPIPSYDKDDKSIPWSYDIRSFFKTSDENPFYSYELPYITLIKNDEEYSDLRIVRGRALFYSKSIDLEQFLVYNDQGGVQELLAQTDYEVQTTVTGRSVKLQGMYQGFGQSSWESYQWVLYDENYNIVQDTGKKYDKNMSVIFYGLSNDTTTNIQYTALLLVENNFGDVITYTVDLIIKPGEIADFINNGGEFSVVFDCSTHSNIITYKESQNMEENDENIFLYSIYKREYDVLMNPSPKIACYSNVTEYHVIPTSGIILYTDEECTELLVGRAGYIYVDQNQYTYKYITDSNTYDFAEDFKIYKGSWQPVLISDKRQKFRDFNISNDRSYEYIIYPTNSLTTVYGLTTNEQAFANFDGKIWTTLEGIDKVYAEGELVNGNDSTSIYIGEPARSHWECWSITELIPENLDTDAPVIRKQYKVDNNNIWLFKYSLETGSQNQNISKEEFSTLGRFSKFGFGNKNYESGSVNALLGSELVLSSKVKYVERLGKSRVLPLSSNEKAQMVEQWNAFCYSKNPKLLKDIKGRSWIVQVVSNTVTPANLIYNTPATISFEWRQIDTTNNLIIYGDYATNDQKIKATIGAPQWNSPYDTSIIRG